MIARHGCCRRASDIPASASRAIQTAETPRLPTRGFAMNTDALVIGQPIVATVAGSTFTPGPIVDEMATRWM